MGDRGGRVQNRLCDNLWVEHCQRIHKAKLKSMKSTTKAKKSGMDNNEPKRYPHLLLNLKGRQMESERYEKIENENLNLLEKMSKIMKPEEGATREFAGGVRINSNQYPVIDHYPGKQFGDIKPKPGKIGTLNKEYRRRCVCLERCPRRCLVLTGPVCGGAEPVVPRADSCLVLSPPPLCLQGAAHHHT
jgi:hypothetical protein